MEKQTLVEEGTKLKGSLTSECAVVVRGKVEGDLEAPALTVSGTGAVHGKVKVGRLCSEGELAGDFDAETVELSGVVKDNTILKARSLEVKLTTDEGKLQVVFGQCTVEVGDMPTMEQQVAKPNGSVAAPPITSVTPATIKESVPPPALS
jgi:cytoskeletal protein CcmA (bactofilin family)